MTQFSLRTRSYGESGPTVISLHGGPGAAGELALLADMMSASFRVIEPFQRRSPKDGSLSVNVHVQDLHHLIQSRTSGDIPFLVGASWGALLALAYAAEFPQTAGKIVLIGSGTFDHAARLEFEENLLSRLSLEHIQTMRQGLDSDGQLAQMGAMLLPLYSYDLDALPRPEIEADAKGHREIRSDMIHLQHVKKYPQAFSSIECPVFLIHGDSDPHPGAAIRDSLLPHLPQLEYLELSKCGHYPWLERHCRKQFIELITSEALPQTDKAWERLRLTSEVI